MKIPLLARILRVYCLSILVLLGCSIRGFAQAGKPLPRPIDQYISTIEYGKLGNTTPVIRYSRESEGVVKVQLSWELKDSLRQDDWQVNITPAFQPVFHWSPHLTPTDDYIIAQHVFRAPALVCSAPGKQLIVIPDLDRLKAGSPVGWYMDLDAEKNRLTLGLSESGVKEHVLYVRRPGAVFPPGKYVFGFYVMVTGNDQAIFNPWREILSFSWNKWGRPLYLSNEPLGRSDLEPYVKHTYNWAFDQWKESVWQEFEIDGKLVGACSRVVNVTQSPNYPGEVNERGFRALWNQAWFNSLRSAQGVYRYARRTGNDKLKAYALKTKELALSFPQRSGFFPALVATEMYLLEKDGKQYNRSKGWSTRYFGNSDRGPYSKDPALAPYHILDMSFTAYLMLTWYEELEKDRRLLEYALRYAEALLQLQDAEGFFPAYLDKDNFQPLEILARSPETSMSVSFLIKLYEITGEKKYLSPALKAMKAVTDLVIPSGQWEDFETYWSCCRYGVPDLVGKKVKRNNMFKQNTFSMYWTAEALLHCYRITGNRQYLAQGQRTLDELLMAQAVWQPPYMYVNTFGGFGVMNADGEWNDARQSLFSELIIQYGKVLNMPEYVQRGIAALKASFVMMYCPENPRTKHQWEKRWEFLGEKDYGFMMENYAHTGRTGKDGLGIGEFTIYDWGNGAASEAYNRIVDHYGIDFLSLLK